MGNDIKLTDAQYLIYIAGCFGSSDEKKMDRLLKISKKLKHLEELSFLSNELENRVDNHIHALSKKNEIIKGLRCEIECLKKKNKIYEKALKPIVNCSIEGAAESVASRFLEAAADSIHTLAESGIDTRKL